VWEQGRQKHERLLRPGLGSPEAREVLEALHLSETQRSQDLCEHALLLRSQLARGLGSQLRGFLTGLARAHRGLLLYLDRVPHPEALHLPPDTNRPHKHATLKKLRKALRLREEVRAGQEERSHVRMWPPLDCEHARRVIGLAELLVADLGQDPADLPTPLVEEAPGPKKAPTKKTTPGEKAKPDKAPPAPVEKPTLMSAAFVAAVRADSEVRAAVSPAHRALLAERDRVARRFTDTCERHLEEIRTDMDTLLSQEDSWRTRWGRQVQMLREGRL